WPSPARRSSGRSGSDRSATPASRRAATPAGSSCPAAGEIARKRGRRLTQKDADQDRELSSNQVSSSSAWFCVYLRLFSCFTLLDTTSRSRDNPRAAPTPPPEDRR